MSSKAHNRSVRSQTTRLSSHTAPKIGSVAPEGITEIAARPEIEALVTGMDIMEEDERRDVARYLEDFWETVTDDGQARRRIEGACRPI